MTTKVIVDNHAGFHIAVDHVENGKLVRTDRTNPNQPHYDTIIHSGKYVVVREEHDGAKSPMSFGMAIEEMKRGNKVARAGWNGKGMWLILVEGTPNAVLHEGTPYYKHLSDCAPEGAAISCEILPHIDMWTINASGRRAMLPGWVASQSDVLAEDWVIVE